MPGQERKSYERLIVQLGVPFLVSIILVLLVLSVSTLFSYQRNRKEALKKPEALAVNVSNDVRTFFGEIQADLEFAANIAGQLDQYDDDVRIVYRNLVARNPALLGLLIVDIDGNEVLRASESHVSDIVTESIRAHTSELASVFIQGTSELFSPFISESRTPLAVWGVPVRNPAGEVVGVVAATIDVSGAWTILSSYQERNEGRVYIIDSAGGVIVSVEKGAPEMIQIQGVGVKKSDLLSLSDRNVQTFQGLFGQTVVGTWEPLSPTEWVLVSEIPKKFLFRDLQALLVIFALFLIILLTFFVYEIAVFRRVLLHPLQVMVNAITLFAERKSSERIELSVQNELGLLSDQFNRMSDELSQSYAGLEKRVQEKTIELQRVLDDSENKNTALEEERVRDKALFEGIAMGLVYVSKERKVLLANKMAARLIEMTEESILGSMWPDIARPVNSEGIPIPIEELPIVEALKMVTTVQVPAVFTNIYFTKKSGKHFPVEVTASPVVLRGEVIGGVITYRDAEKEKDIDRAKNEFISFTSHQLRTPMTKIRWTTELLLKGKYGELEEKQRGIIHEIAKINNRMIAFAGTLLNISRIELGTLSSSAEDIDIKSLVGDIVNELSPSILEKGTVTSISIQEDIGVVHTDLKLLRIVVENLFSNAVKYTEKGGTVRFLAKTEAGMLHMEVSDDGYGIPEAEQGKIFTKLFRASNVAEFAEGTGLGLYMVKNIVTMLDGTIRFESHEGQGTTFFVEIPMTPSKKQKTL